MKKIAIIGSSGAGKTTFAKELDDILKIKAYHMDRMFWQHSWKGKDSETRIDILQQLVQNKQWIIEGTYLSLSESRLNAADIIIFLDTHPLVCLLRIIMRHRKDRGRSRRDIPEGCTDRLTLLLILRVLVVFPLRERSKLEKKLREFPREKVIWLHSAKEVKAFLLQPELYVHEKRQSAKTPSVLEQFFDIISCCFFFLREFSPF
jgi:adenylate kinase family enzyme